MSWFNERLCHGAAEVGVGQGRLEVAGFELSDRGGIVFGHAAGVRFVPHVIAEAHGYSGDAIAVSGEEFAGVGALFGSVAWRGRDSGGQCQSVLPASCSRIGSFLRTSDSDLASELGVQVHMPPGVIPDEEPASSQSRA